VQPATPRRRPPRPVAEAPLEELAGDAERLAKGWLVAVIEAQPLSEAPAIAGRDWAREATLVCAAAVRALGSDEQLSRLGSPWSGLEGSLDELRAVLWSALRAAWPEAAPDQVWDLGERLALVIESVQGAPAPAWPGTLEDTVARARAAGEPLALLLAELVDAGRISMVEDAESFARLLNEFRAAIRTAAGAERVVVDDGDARAWVVAPGAGREAADALGASVDAAVRAGPGWRGAPLIASVGVAVLGEDGDDAEALLETAERSMLAAAAGGSEV
jgi:GGDEF domain-containing protein